MKIVKQSAEIIEPMGIMEQIAEAGKVCYQVDQVNGGPEAFFERIVNRGHWSVLEMANITLLLRFKKAEYAVAFQLIASKFMEVASADGVLIVTGSVRTWREWITKGVIGEVSLFVMPIYAYIANEIISMAIPLLESIGKGVLDESSVYSSIDKVDVEDDLSSSLYPGHMNVMAKLVVNRAFTHDIVRHRPCSFLQESQRWCRYDDERFEGELTFICPELFFEQSSPEYALWERHCSSSEQLYLKLLKSGYAPQAARTVLPNSTKAEIIIYANLRQWKHIFSLRAENKAADPTIRALMIPLQEEFKKRGWLE